MKVKICYTVYINDYMRRKINERFGKDGLADRKQIQQWYEQNGLSSEDDLRETESPYEDDE